LTRTVCCLIETLSWWGLISYSEDHRIQYKTIKPSCEARILNYYIEIVVLCRRTWEIREAHCVNEIIWSWIKQSKSCCVNRDCFWVYRKNQKRLSRCYTCLNSANNAWVSNLDMIKIYSLLLFVQINDSHIVYRRRCRSEYCVGARVFNKDRKILPRSLEIYRGGKRVRIVSMVANICAIYLNIPVWVREVLKACEGLCCWIQSECNTLRTGWIFNNGELED
jgi:hypothetical protein